MTQRRPLSRNRVTIDDLARAYDRSAAGKPVRLPVRRPTAGAVARVQPRSFSVAQGDTRLARLKARADGIRFALQYENQTVAKARVLRQILQNLELAIRGMEMTQNES